MRSRIFVPLVSLIAMALLSAPAWADHGSKNRDARPWHGRMERQQNWHGNGNRGWSAPNSYYDQGRSTPPGWSHGRKTGWGNCDLPPGQAKKYGCSNEPSAWYGPGAWRGDNDGDRGGWRNRRNRRDDDDDDDRGSWRGNRYPYGGNGGYSNGGYANGGYPYPGAPSGSYPTGRYPYPTSGYRNVNHPAPPRPIARPTSQNQPANAPAPAPRPRRVWER